MSTPVDYGVLFNTLDDDLQPMVQIDMSTLYCVGTSDDATDATIPLNESRMFNSSDPVFLAALGTGPLATAVRLVNANLGPFQLAARIIVHRVAKGATDAETIANIVGNQANGTGIYGALACGQRFGVTPRLFFFADGLTGVFTRGPTSTVVTRAAKFGGNTGTGLMTLASPAYGVGVKAGVYRVRAKTAAANGGVFSVVDPDGLVLDDATVGTAYTGVVKFTIADGATDFVVGDGFDLTVTLAEGPASVNPICAALPQVLNALLANAIVSGPGTTVQDDRDWRETLSSERLIPVSTWVTAVGMAEGSFIEPGPVAAGIGVRVDAQTRGKVGVPSQSFANQAVYGVTALKRYDTFSLSDGANDGQQLLADDIGIIQRGETGVDTAAVSSGFVLICYANAGTSRLNRFFNVTRTRDYALLQILRAWRARLGVTNITRTGIQAFENDADAILSRLQTDEHIIGYLTGIGAGNTPETIRAGRFRFKIRNEPASPFLVAEADVYRYRDALNALLADVAGGTNAALAPVT